MKRYKLLKDTLTVKAGSIFEEEGTFDDEKRLVLVTKDGYQFSPSVVVRDIDNFDEWFEEIPKPKRWRGKLGETYWFLSDNGSIYCKADADTYIDYYRYLVGNYFKTKEEVKVYKKYFIARQVLLDDAEGGEFILYKVLYYAVYMVPALMGEWRIESVGNSYTPGMIYFKNEESLEKSLEEHKEQWEIVRKYEIGEM